MQKRFLFLSIPCLSLGLMACQPPAPNEPEVQIEPPLPDFTLINDVKEKKEAFFSYLIPLIHQANKQIQYERTQLEDWISADDLSEQEQEQFEGLLLKYRIKTDDPIVRKQLIERRVNPLPTSLVLAQAANESAWGTSRFAREGNNLFGQWCFSLGCGLIPGERNHRARHEVRVFDSPYQSVTSYMLNLNTHPQYQNLRELRLIETDLVGYSTGLNLSIGLEGYSQRGEEYVKEVQKMIQINNLTHLDASMTIQSTHIGEG